MTENNKIILGFDLSMSESSCCLFKTPDDFAFEDLIVGKKIIKSIDIDIEKDIIRFQIVANWISKTIEAHKEEIDQVGVEGLAFGARSKAVTKLAGLQATILGRIYSDFNKLIPLIIYPGEARKAYFGKLQKKHFANPGGKVKEEIFKRLNDKHPDKITTDHQADAYLIAWFIWDLRQKEAEVNG